MPSYEICMLNIFQVIPDEKQLTCISFELNSIDTTQCLLAGILIFYLYVSYAATP